MLQLGASQGTLLVAPSAAKLANAACAPFRQLAYLRLDTLVLHEIVWLKFANSPHGAIVPAHVCVARTLAARLPMPLCR